MVKIKYDGKGKFLGKKTFRKGEKKEVSKEYAEYLLKNFPSFFKKDEKSEKKQKGGKE